jgi:Fe-S oxidoreductase
MLNVPKNSTVSIYNSGCCGMAGSFGYEKNIMTLVCKWGGYFISKIRSTAPTTIAAAGTSCRHQFFDGTNRNAEHPVTILKNLLK